MNTMTEARRADTGVEERTCGYGRCVKEHPLHCCHAAVTVRLPLGRGKVCTDEVGFECVSCKKRSRTWTVVAVDQYGDIVPVEEGEVA